MIADFSHFIVCFLAVFSNILKIPQIQVLADSDEQEVVQQVQVYVAYMTVKILIGMNCLRVGREDGI